MAKQIQLRRDTAARWVTFNPMLAEGELGIETDTLKFKLGDGVHTWSQLEYSGPRGIFPYAAALEIGWNEDYPSNFTELTYESDKISKVDVWEDDSKTTHLFTKDFTYTTGKLSSVTITDLLKGSTMTKAIIYEAGKVKSVTRSYTAGV